MIERPRQSLTPNVPKLGINSSNKDTPNVKKRHRRAKSGGVKNVDPGAGDGKKQSVAFLLPERVFAVNEVCCLLRVQFMQPVKKPILSISE